MQRTHEAVILVVESAFGSAGRATMPEVPAPQWTRWATENQVGKGGEAPTVGQLRAYRNPSPAAAIG